MKKNLLLISSLLINALSVFSQNFEYPAKISAAYPPSSVIGADFNNDGKDELLYSLYYSSTMQLVKTYDGEYPVNVDLPAHSGVTSAFAGDIDDDGNTDIVYVKGGIYFFKGNGDLSFENQASITLNNNSGITFSALKILGIKDLTKDGKNDLIVLGDGYNIVIGVNQGNNMFKFESGTVLSDGSIYSVVQIDDINDDNNLDILISDSRIFKVYFGNGDGTFPTNTVVSYGNSNNKNNNVVLGQAEDGDMYLDIVTLNTVNHAIDVYKNDGAGVFTLFKEVIVNVNSEKLIGKDINNDNYVDLLLLERDGYTGIDVFEGNATADYSLSYSKDIAVNQYYYNSYHYNFNFINLNNDGVSDYYYFTQGNQNNINELNFVKGNAITGKPELPAKMKPLNASFLETADVNSDGIDDLLFLKSGTDSLFVAYGADGTIEETSYFICDKVVSITSGFFNFDFHLDIVAFGDQKIVVLLGDGAGNFTKSVIDFAGDYNYITKGDFNNDNKLDIFYGSLNTTNAVTFVRLGNNDGTFGAAKSISSGNTYVRSFQVADFNNDNYDDLLTFSNTQTAGQKTRLYFSQGDGTFIGSQVDEKLEFGIIGQGHVVSADFNKDGLIDIGAIEGGGGSFSVYLNHGDSTFTAGGTDYSSYAGSISNTSVISIADFNNDGDLDFTVNNTTNSGVYGATVNYLKAGKNAGQQQYYFGRYVAKDMLVGNFNADNKPDIITRSGLDNFIYILKNNFEIAAAPTKASTDIKFNYVSADSINVSFVKGNAQTINYYIIESASSIVNPLSTKVIKDTVYLSYRNLKPNKVYSLVISDCNGSGLNQSCLESVQDSTKTLRGSQEIYFSLPDSMAYYATFTMTYRAKSDLPISYEIISGNATLNNNNQLLINGLGDITIKASQSGDDSWYPAPDTIRTIKIYKATQAITSTLPASLAYTKDTILLNNFFSTPSNLPISYFVVAGYNIARILPGNKLVVDSIGSITFWATQAGNDNYFSAQQVEKTMLITKANQTITGNGNSSYVYFQYEGMKIDSLLGLKNSSKLPLEYTIANGNASINGNMIELVDLTQQTITVSQPGNYFYNPTISQNFTLNVLKSTSVISFKDFPEDLKSGDTLELADYIINKTNDKLYTSYYLSSGVGTAVVDNSTGRVIFSTAGQFQFYAVKQGDALFYSSGPVYSKSLCVKPITPIITVTPPTYQGGYYTYSATNVDYPYTGLNWYLNNDQLYSGSNNINDYSERSGKLYAIINLGGCASDTSNIIGLNITGIDSDKMNNAAATIYPNPANSFVNISVDALQEDVNVKIINYLGVIVYENYYGIVDNELRISVSDFAPGMYELILNSKNFRSIQSLIIVK